MQTWHLRGSARPVWAIKNNLNYQNYQNYQIYQKWIKKVNKIKSYLSSINPYSQNQRQFFDIDFLKIKIFKQEILFLSKHK